MIEEVGHRIDIRLWVGRTAALGRSDDTRCRNGEAWQNKSERPVIRLRSNALFAVARGFLLLLASSSSSLAVVGGATTGCSSDPEELSDPDLPPIEVNPDGIPYPTDHIGGLERTAFRPGDRIPNITFKGYKDGNRAAGLTNLSLADYYDPEQKRHKVLHLQLAATWCSICSSELEATVSVAEQLKTRGIVFLEVVVSGATAGKGPSESEFDDWVARHKTNFSTGVDVRARRLSAIGVNGAAMPHDILLDTRTMEILDSSVGAPADVVKYVEEGLTFVTKNPPSY